VNLTAHDQSDKCMSEDLMKKCRKTGGQNKKGNQQKINENYLFPGHRFMDEGPGLLRADYQ
jgi:hypothetical protein